MKTKYYSLYLEFWKLELKLELCLDFGHTFIKEYLEFEFTFSKYGLYPNF